jgi:hypothetical protein
VCVCVLRDMLLTKTLDWIPHPTIVNDESHCTAPPERGVLKH